jgi:hypothetical protein
MMKLKNITAPMALLFLSFSVITSCEKADSAIAYGNSKIYMPAAINKSGGVSNDYPVPSGVDSSTFNYIIDKKENKIRIALGATLSGPQNGAYGVDISVNTDTVQKVLSNGTFNPATYQLMPASMYTVPARLDVPAGKRSGTFYVSIDIPQLKLNQYAGKFLLLAVTISNPSGYPLNAALSTTMIILDVNALVIGPRKDFVGGEYLKNPGNPFIASALQTGQTRWGTLANWTANAPALSHGGTGGFNSPLMGLESGWGSAQILNGKIYQTVTLPAGYYYYDISGGNWSGGENFMKDPGYSVVSIGKDSLPDYNNIAGNAAIIYQAFAKPVQPLINFELTATTKVTLGLVINYAQTEQGFKTKQVFLYTYPNHL